MSGLASFGPAFLRGISNRCFSFIIRSFLCAYFLPSQRVYLNTREHFSAWIKIVPKYCKYSLPSPSSRYLSYNHSQVSDPERVYLGTPVKKTSNNLFQTRPAVNMGTGLELGSLRRLCTSWSSHSGEGTMQRQSPERETRTRWAKLAEGSLQSFRASSHSHLRRLFLPWIWHLSLRHCDPPASASWNAVGLFPIKGKRKIRS